MHHMKNPLSSSAAGAKTSIHPNLHDMDQSMEHTLALHSLISFSWFIPPLYPPKSDRLILGSRRRMKAQGEEDGRGKSLRKWRAEKGSVHRPWGLRQIDIGQGYMGFN